MLESSDERLAGLFAEYIEALEQGRDVAHELLDRAGELRPALEERIAIERDLRALSRDLGMAQRSPDAPQFIGRFQILGSLARTALSRVFLAFDPDVGREIALKILDRASLLEKDQGAWIRNEARTLARIKHRAVVKVYEVGETGTHTYIAMELLPGPSLHELIHEWARVRDGGTDAPRPEVVALAARLRPIPARIACLAQLADALAQCHDNGVLHRDIKPQNVLFDGDGEPRLIDFGLAHDDEADEDSQLGLTQSLVGTAAYIAPEQVENDRTGADARSDQFSFGTVTYECFALANPFQRKSRRATLDAIAAADPPALRTQAPEVPPHLARVIHHALVRDPVGRYPSMRVLAGDLRALLEHRPVSVVAPTVAHLAHLWLRRHRRGVAVASLAFALALGTSVAAWLSRAIGDRNAIRDELARIRPEEFQTPLDLHASFEALHDLQRRAKEFESGLVRGSLSGGVAAEAGRTVDAWSLSLRNLHGAELARSREEGVIFQEGIYTQLFWQDSVLCPDGTHNLDYRRRGQVVFPLEELGGREISLGMLSQLEGYSAPMFVSGFRSAVRTDLLLSSPRQMLMPGVYRFLVSDPAGSAIAMEAVFFVPDSLHPEFALDVHPPRGEYVDKSIPIERTVVRLQGDRKLTVPSFRIVDHLVTVAEFDAFVAETNYPQRARQTIEDPAPEDPIWVDYASAFAFASWVGGRLPFYAEMKAAVDSEKLTSPEETPWACGEYVIDLNSPRALSGSFLAYDDWVLGLVPSREELVHCGSKTAPSSPGFRVVFADDELAVYAELEGRSLQILDMK